MLVLIRHAQPRPDPAIPARLWPLSPEGERAARRLAGVLPEVVALWSSDERKAQATAVPLGAARGLPVRVHPGLAELRRPWMADGAAYNAAVRRCLARPEQPAAPGWESADAALQRLLQALAEIGADHPHGAVAIVSHGLVLSLERALLLGLGQADFAAWRDLPMPAWAVADAPRGRLLRDFGPG